MHILFVHNATIPVQTTGGIERIIWWLGRELSARGHKISYLVKKQSTCPFGDVYTLNTRKSLASQIPEGVDLVHLHDDVREELPVPSLFTLHHNRQTVKEFPHNTVFLSKNHARRHGGKVFVHNGLDFDRYLDPVLTNQRRYFHFLGDTGSRVKNVRGAIELTGKAGVNLHVIGGTRVQIRSPRFTLNPHVRFHGLLSGDGRNVLLNGSEGFVYPVLWHEPFGLAVIESLYYGCPVFGTPFGSLPELLGGRDNLKGQLAGSVGKVDAVYSDFGCLSTRKTELVSAIKNAGSYDRKECHDYVTDVFNHKRMVDDYLKLYEKVLSGVKLHEEMPRPADSGKGEKLRLENK